MRKIELLVPASSLEVLKIAVIFGADAVYIGGEAFGLRAKAKNFSHEDIWKQITIWSCPARNSDKLYLETYMKDYPGRFRILDESLETSKLAVAFSKDTDPELVDKLNETLNEMKLDGTIDRILEKYETSVENAS